MNWMLFGYLLIVIVPISILMTVIPYLTRRTESFGVSIEERYYHDPEISSMRRFYAMGTGLSGFIALIAALIAAFYLEESAMGWFAPTVISFIMLVHTVLYLRFHFRMKKLKQERGLLSAEVQQVVVDTKFHHQKRTYSQWWLLPHVIVMAITAWIAIYYYDDFPAQIVMQTDFQGNPAKLVDKSYMSVLFPVFIQLFLIVLFWIINYSISISKQQIDASKPDVSIQQNLLFRRKWSGYLLIIGFLTVVMIGVIPLQMLVQFETSYVLAFTLIMISIILFGAIRLSFITGQGGSRIQIGGKQSVTGAVNRDDDRYWKLGIFYYNPQDPALFLEKRFGVGWTINFARPLAWLIMFLPVLIAVLISIFLQ